MMWRVLVAIPLLLFSGCQLALNGEDYFSPALDNMPGDWADLPYDFKQRIAVRFYETHDSPFDITSAKISTESILDSVEKNKKLCISLQVVGKTEPEIFIASIDMEHQINIAKVPIVRCQHVIWKPFPEVVIDY